MSQRLSSLGILCALGALVLHCGSDNKAAPTTPTFPVNVAPPAPTPVPPPRPENPPVIDAHTTPSPAVGAGPLDVHLNACQSSDPDGDRLFFSFDFGDGKKKDEAFCRQTHTYSRGSYAAKVCVSDGRQQVCQVFAISVS